MNSKEVASNIDKILSNHNEKNPVCIFIDGPWGIGKTHSIKNFKDKKNFKYFSVFGKSSVDSIRKELILEIRFSASSIFNQKYKPIMNIGNVLFKNKIGISIDTYIESLSIELLENDKNYIICIDDIERKSENIEFIELLGLIERLSEKFNVIAIGSTSNIIKEDELHIFNKFKEKVIDYEFIIDEIDDDVIISKINQKNKLLKNYDLENIINGFKALEHKNIRILDKYLNLIFSLNSEITQIMNKEKFWLDSDLIFICSNIIKVNYIEHDKDKITSIKNNIKSEHKQIYSCIEKYYNYHKIKEEIIHIYFEKDRELNRDIHLIRNIYELDNEEQLTKILNKIYKRIYNINANNFDTYFKYQEDVINLFDSLIDLGDTTIENGIYYEKLLNIAGYLYDPRLSSNVLIHENMDWIHGNYIVGPIFYKQVDKFIDEINYRNKKIYNEYIINEIKDSLHNKKYPHIRQILLNKDIEFDEEYKDIFKLLFKNLKEEFNKDLWDSIISLSLIIDDIDFIKKIKCDGFVDKSRIKYLQEVIEEERFIKQQLNGKTN